MKKLCFMIAFLVLMTTLFAETTPQLIPAPREVVLQGDAPFVLSQSTVIVDTVGSDLTAQVAKGLQEKLAPATGFSLKITSADTKAGAIRLELLPVVDETLGTEGYRLESGASAVVIVANEPHGLFNGVQTLLQLLPAEIVSNEIQRVKWSIPSVKIEDFPEYAWRGLMFDVSRHFFTKDEMLRYIDTMAQYKYNVFHWHLTDDQGWRIEIKQYPELTEIGAWRVPREGNWWSFDPPKRGEEATYGGFYTQDEIREVVAYAADRFITVVPEIDVPGHCQAVLACYPELGCKTRKGKNLKVNPGSKFWGKEPNTLCPGNEEVYTFLDNVFAEVIELFPAEYIHIGGDEAWHGFWRWCSSCRKQRMKEGIVGVHKQQSHFIQRVEKLVESRGRKMMGWDEILQGGLADNAAVMSWRGIEGGVKAAKMKHNVVMSPSPYYYLDLYQGDPAFEPNTYNLARLKTTYDFNPMPPDVDPQYILGVQGNLWTEEVSEYRHAEYMTWPRSFAIAEAGWIADGQKDWNSFQTRVEAHFDRFDFAKQKYAKSVYDPQAMVSNEGGNNMLTLFTEFDGTSIHYSFGGAEPDEFYPVYAQPIVIPSGAKMVRAVSYKDGELVSRLVTLPLCE